MGCSQGGFVSALTSAKHPELVTKLVLFYPALCIPDDARAGRMMFARFDPKNIPEIIDCGPMKLGKCYVADVIGMDPFEEIKAYPGPVLIIHGEDDRFVPCDMSRENFEACASRKRLVTIPGAGHGLSYAVDPQRYLEELRDFFGPDASWQA